MSVQSTTPLSFTVASSSTLNAVDVTNGQIVALNDADGLYYDMGNSRHKVGDDPSSVKSISQNGGYSGDVLRFGTDANGNYGYYGHNGAFHKWRNPQGDATPNDVLQGSTFSNATQENISGAITTYSNKDIGVVPGVNASTYTANGTYTITPPSTTITTDRFGATEVSVTAAGSTFAVNVHNVNITTQSLSTAVYPSMSWDENPYTPYTTVSASSGYDGFGSLSIQTQQYASTFSYNDRTVGASASSFQYVATSNVNGDGEIISGSAGYSNNEAWTEVIPLDTSKRYVYVQWKYQTESASYDWGCIWKGAHSDYTAYDNHGSSFTGKLAGTSLASSYSMFDLQSDSTLASDPNLTVAFRADGSVNNYLGLYVMVLQSDTSLMQYTAYDDNGNQIITPRKHMRIRGTADGMIYKNLTDQYYIGNSLSSILGDATPSQVRKGKTFSSIAGFKLTGTAEIGRPIVLGGRVVDHLIMPSDVDMYNQAYQISYGWIDRYSDLTIDVDPSRNITNALGKVVGYAVCTGIDPYLGASGSQTHYTAGDIWTKVIQLPSDFFTSTNEYVITVSDDVLNRSTTSGYGCIWVGNHPSWTAQANSSSGYGITGMPGASMYYTGRGFTYFASELDSDTLSRLQSDPYITVAFWSNSSTSVSGQYGGFSVFVVKLDHRAPTEYPQGHSKYLCWDRKITGVGLHATVDYFRRKPLSIDSISSPGSSGVIYVFHNQIEDDYHSFYVRYKDATYWTMLEFQRSGTTVTCKYSYQNGGSVYNDNSLFTITVTANQPITMIMIPVTDEHIVLMYMWATSAVAYTTLRTRKIYLRGQSPSADYSYVQASVTSEVAMGTARTSRASRGTAGTQWETTYMLYPAEVREESPAYHIDIIEDAYAYGSEIPDPYHTINFGYCGYQNFGSCGGGYALAPSYMRTCRHLMNAISGISPTHWNLIDTTWVSKYDITGEVVVNGSTTVWSDIEIPYLGAYRALNNTYTLYTDPHGGLDTYDIVAQNDPGVSPYWGDSSVFCFGIIDNFFIGFYRFPDSTDNFDLMDKLVLNISSSEIRIDDPRNNGGTQYRFIYQMTSASSLSMENTTYGKLLQYLETNGKPAKIFSSTVTHSESQGTYDIIHMFAYNNTIVIVCDNNRAYGFYCNPIELMSIVNASNPWPFYYLGSCPVDRSLTSEELSTGLLPDEVTEESQILLNMFSTTREVSGVHMYDIVFKPSNDA